MLRKKCRFWQKPRCKSTGYVIQLDTTVENIVIICKFTLDLEFTLKMISNYGVCYIIVFKFYYLFFMKNNKSLHQKKKKNELNN